MDRMRKPELTKAISTGLRAYTETFLHTFVYDGIVPYLETVAT